MKHMMNSLLSMLLALALLAGCADRGGNIPATPQAAADLVSMLPYKQTIVDVIPLGHAESGADAMAGCAGTVRLELVKGSKRPTDSLTKSC